MTADDNTNATRRGEEVSPLELLFDIVFAFAISQLSQHLSANMSWRGGLETMVLLLAIQTVWSFTSWAATMVSSTTPKTRSMLLVVMLLGLFMNAALPGAFVVTPWAFAIPLLLIQLGRTAWTIATAPNELYREHYFRVLWWFMATTPLWIIGSWVAPSPRLWWWGLAAGIELVGTWLAHPVPGRRLRSRQFTFDADHMLERCSLFLIIALGETILTTGTAIAQSPTTLLTAATGSCALAGTVALWALTFGRSHRLTRRYAQASSDPVRVSRHAVNAVVLMVAGLVGVAVANRHIIAHPYEPGSVALILLLAGGPILFLVAQAWFLFAVPHVRSRFHVLAMAILVMTGLLGLLTPPYVSLVMVGAALSTLAIIEPSQNGDVVETERTIKQH